MQVLDRLFADSHFRAALLGSLASLITKVVAAMAGVVLTFVIARRFGAAGSGAWVLSLTFLTIAGYVCLCGLDYGTTRAVAVYRAAERWGAVRSWTWTGLGIIVIAGVALTALALLLAAPLARALSEGALFERLLRILAVAMVPYAILRFMAGAFRGVRRLALADALDSGVVSAFLVLSVLILGLDRLEDVARAYAAVSALAAIAAFGVWLAFLRRQPPGREPPMPRAALTRSLPLAGTVLATLASPWIVTLFLAQFASTVEVGVYRVALQCALLLGFLLNAVETGLSPQIAALHSEHKLEELSHAAKRMTLLLLVAGGLPAVIFVVFAGWFLSLFGPEFPQAALALQILIGAQAFNLATGPVGAFMVMAGLGRLSFWNAIAGAIVVFVLGFLLIPTYGPVGAAIASGAATILRNAIATVLVWRHLGLFLPLGISRRPN